MFYCECAKYLEDAYVIIPRFWKIMYAGKSSYTYSRIFFSVYICLYLFIYLFISICLLFPLKNKECIQRKYDLLCNAVILRSTL